MGRTFLITFVKSQNIDNLNLVSAPIVPEFIWSETGELPFAAAADQKSV